MIIDVKKIVENQKKELIKRTEKLKKKGIVPKLAIIKASDDKASDIYISKKRQLCAEIGLEELEYIFNENVKQEEVISKINELNGDKSVHGIMVQLPLFKHLDEKKIISAISKDKDADGLSEVNIGNLISGKKAIVSCTPKGIMNILDNIGIDIKGKDAVVVGRSLLVGKPVAILLLERGATVTICHSKTEDLKKHTRTADILVVATGKPSLITADMVKKGATVIDVGITRTENGIKGDVDTENVAKKAKYITKVPGGVGLTTVVSLIENVIEIAENSIEK